MRVLVVVPTWKRKEALERITKALKRQSEQNFDALFIGDAQDFDLVGFMYLQTDANCIKSLNMGIEFALENGYDWIVFFDDDSVPHTEYFKAFKHAVYGEVCVGGPCSLNREECGKLPKVNFDGSLSGDFRRFYRNDPTYVDHVQGCNWAVKTKVIRKHNLRFDEELSRVSFRSETDFQQSLKKYGYKILFHPALGVNHLNMDEGSFQKYDRDDFWRGFDHAHFSIKHFGAINSLIGILFTGSHPKPIWIGLLLSLFRIRKGYHHWYTGYFYRISGGRSK